MLSRTLIVAAVLAALAGCDKASSPSASRDATKGASSPSSTAGASQTPSTPANLPPSTQAEKREGANPVQGQVDPKEGAQHKDFQQKGDSAGPTSADTVPRK
jgi:hypothetical protein